MSYKSGCIVWKENIGDCYVREQKKYITAKPKTQEYNITIFVYHSDA